jgi:hypothetical protein
LTPFPFPRRPGEHNFVVTGWSFDAEYEFVMEGVVMEGGNMNWVLGAAIPAQHLGSRPVSLVSRAQGISHDGGVWTLWPDFLNGGDMDKLSLGKVLRPTRPGANWNQPVEPFSAVFGNRWTSNDIWTLRWSPDMAQPTRHYEGGYK